MYKGRLITARQYNTLYLAGQGVKKGQRATLSAFCCRSKLCLPPRGVHRTHLRDCFLYDVAPRASSSCKPPRDPSLRSRMTTGRRREGSSRDIKIRLMEDTTSGVFLLGINSASFYPKPTQEGTFEKVPS